MNITHTEAKQSVSLPQGSPYLAKPGLLCTKQVLCAGAVEPGKELTGEPTVSLTAGMGTKVPPMPLVINETQPVYFALQYKTRYPFYRWVGWSTVMFFPHAL